MNTIELLEELKNKTIDFATVLEYIESLYTHTPTGFTNGVQRNESTQNQGSAKVFGFANAEGLSKEDTLFLFAEHYQSVLDTPNDADHHNIRQFMLNGWNGIIFDGIVLEKK